MLILTRRVGETLMVGDEVTITVLAVKGNQVRIGVNAPKDVPVHREEIYRRILNEKSGDKPSHNKDHNYGHNNYHEHKKNYNECCGHHNDGHKCCGGLQHHYDDEDN